MDRRPVVSSNLRAIGYDSPTKTLEIEFNSGGIYQYQKVPVCTYEALMSAASPGSYFHRYIKDSYDCKRIG